MSDHTANSIHYRAPIGQRCANCRHWLETKVTKQGLGQCQEPKRLYTTSKDASCEDFSPVSIEEGTS